MRIGYAKASARTIRREAGRRTNFPRTRPNVLLLAHQLAPQVAPIRLEAAALLMNRNQFAEAEALLLPRTAEPHARRIATSARNLLKARSRERAGDVDFEDIEHEQTEGVALSRTLASDLFFPIARVGEAILVMLRFLALFWGLVGAALLAATPAQAEWRRAESPNFIVYGEGSEARLRQRILLLEDFHRLLTVVTGIQPEEVANKLNVYLVSGIDDLRIFRPAQPGLAGFYIATPYGTAAFVDSASEAGGNEVLFHEYSHHFMWQYAPSAYPAWFVEGFADYYMTARFRERDMEFGNYSTGRAVLIADGSWLPMERVLFGTSQGLNRRDTGQYYAQSWFTAHYFYSTAERRERLRRYLRAIRTGTDPRVALEREAGYTPQALTAELRTYARTRLSYWRVSRTPTAAPEVTVTVLPRSANDLLLLEAALRIGVHNQERGDLLARVRAAAARHADDPYARRILAHAEVMHGDRAAGDRLLEPLIAAAPGDAELLYLRGMRYLREAEQSAEWDSNARNAARWFTRAHRADENHYQTLYRYAQSLRGRESFDTENTANVLMLAHQLAPQVVEISMNTASMLIGRRDFDTAEAILRPLAASPHGETLANAAQQLLEQIETQRQATDGQERRTEPANGQ